MNVFDIRKNYNINTRKHMNVQYELPIELVNNGDCNNRHYQLMIYLKRIQFYTNSLKIDLNYTPLQTKINYVKPIGSQANGKLPKI